MIKTSGIDLLGFLLLCTSIWGSIIFSAADEGFNSFAPLGTLTQRCSNMIVTLGECLTFARAETKTPSNECCVAASETRKKDPVCLCYVIQQVHKNITEIQALSLRKDNVLYIPIACHMKNSSISLCLKYLNIPPGSTDYAFFRNPPPAVNPSPPTTSPPKKDADRADGIMPRPDIAAAVAIVVFITGLMSMIHT